MLHFLADSTSTVSFPTTAYPPLALGFFGLGVGYLIYGPQELLSSVFSRNRMLDITTGIWGVWMPGFLQFLTGTYLFLSLVIFHSITEAPLYMAALAFTAYGVHWFAIGLGRAFSSDARPNGLMSVGFFAISLLGTIVFFTNHDNPVGGLFIGLMCVYVSESAASFGVGIAEKALGFFHTTVGLWLLYLTFAVTLNFTSGYSLPV